MKRLFFVFVLAGCSDLSAENSAENALGIVFSDCKSINIDSVNMINGRYLENGSYLANIEATITVKPLAQNASIYNDSADKKIRFDKLEAEQEKANKQYFTDKNALEKQLDGSMVRVDDERWGQQREENRQTLNNFEQKYFEEDRVNYRLPLSKIGYSPEDDMKKVLRNFYTDCKLNSQLGRSVVLHLMDPSIYGDVTPSVAISVFGAGITKTLKIDMELINTTNGWMANN